MFIAQTVPPITAETLTSPTTWIVVAIAALVVLFLIYIFRPRRSNLLYDEFNPYIRKRDDMTHRRGAA